MENLHVESSKDNFSLFIINQNVASEFQCLDLFVSQSLVSYIMEAVQEIMEVHCVLSQCNMQCKFRNMLILSHDHISHYIMSSLTISLCRLYSIEQCINLQITLQSSAAHT